MDDMEKRLTECFSAVLPEMTAEEISHATAASLVSWDSVTTVTLIAVIEDEFDVCIEIDDPSQFDSFQGILGYLRNGERRTQTADNFV